MESRAGLEIVPPLTLGFLSSFQVLCGEVQVMREVAQALSNPVCRLTKRAWPE